MNSKKGVVEIQFNWIFALIAGAVIIALFTGIILKQKNISETSKNSLILNNLDAILSGSEASPGTSKVTRIPETKIEFRCNSYSVDKVSKQINSMTVFTPSVLEGNKLITWTLDWNLPYRITNFVYLTNPRVRYVFVGSSPFAEDIFEKIPDGIEKIKIDSVDQIQDMNDDMVRIIYFGGTTSNLNQIAQTFNNMEKGTVTALKITKDSGNNDIGTLDFFEAENDNFVKKGDSYYIKEPTLFGAIFTDDVKIYNCVMRNAFEKLNIVSQIYREKVFELNGGSCASDYSRNNIDTIFDNSINFNPLDPNIDSILNNLDTAANDLKGQNTEAKEKSCALIY
jgi:hypothetical protein